MLAGFARKRINDSNFFMRVHVFVSTIDFQLKLVLIL